MSALSARGLFRATGKASKPVHVRDLVTGDIVKAAALTREKDEFYRTPAEVTRAILASEGERLRAFPAVWEPAAGDGAMVREMRAFGLNVVASDLVDRGCGATVRSFYDYAEAPAPAILTNPPFAECGWGHQGMRAQGKGGARWLYHALDGLRVDYMALVLNWSWPGAGGLRALWDKHPPARVYLMRWKVDFTGQGAPPMLTGLFVWERGHRGDPALLMMDRVDVRQGSFLDTVLA